MYIFIYVYVYKLPSHKSQHRATNTPSAGSTRATLPHTMYELNGIKKSTLPPNRQLDI